MSKSYGLLIGTFLAFILFTLALFPRLQDENVPEECLLNFPPESVQSLEIFDAPTGETVFLTSRDGLWYFGDKRLQDKYITELLTLLPKIDAQVCTEEFTSYSDEDTIFRITLCAETGVTHWLTVGRRAGRSLYYARTSQSSELYLLDEFPFWQLRDLLNQALMVEPLFRSPLAQFSP